MLSKTKLKEYILLRYDPDEVIELLNIDTEQLLSYIMDLCYRNQHLLVDDEEDIWQ